MNAKRRKEIKEAVFALYNTVVEAAGTCYEKLEAIRDEEQEAYDALPESLQESSRGEAMYEAIEAIESFMDEIEGGSFLDEYLADDIYEGCGIEGGLYD